MSLFDKFKSGLEKSRSSFKQSLDHLFKSSEIGEDFFDEMEETLILGDVGAENATRIIGDLKDEVYRVNIADAFEVKNLLIKKLTDILNQNTSEQEAEGTDSPKVIMVVGVNGSGKTTTIGKIAHRWVKSGKKVMLVAGDTFRAAAIEQLEIWADRVGAEIVKQQAGSDPSSVYYDALHAASSRKIDIVIGDTAGRLHTKVNLMEELKKIHRVIGKVYPDAPREVLLVVDASTGQNGLSQALKFNEAVPVTGVALTKLDGTAKGGIAIAISEQMGLPIHYVGLGEKLDDLEEFDPELFIEALIG